MKSPWRSKCQIMAVAVSLVLLLCNSVSAQSNQSVARNAETHITESEEQAYKRWYDAWVKKETLQAVDLAIRYLQQYPDGRYGDYLRKTLKRDNDCGAQQRSLLPEVVASLIDSGANVNLRMKDGKTALMLAAIEGNADVIITLLQKGSDVNAQEYENERTALTYAVWTRNQTVIQTLLNGGADPRLRDKFGRTSLDDANVIRDDGIINLLKGYM